MRYRVDPRHVKKVEMKDGTVYSASKNGYVEVTRADHVAEMDKGASQFHDFGAASVDRIALHGHIGPRGRECGNCGFAAWPWQRKCPRCDAPL